MPADIRWDADAWPSARNSAAVLLRLGDSHHRYQALVVGRLRAPARMPDLSPGRLRQSAMNVGHAHGTPAVPELVRHRMNGWSARRWKTPTASACALSRGTAEVRFRQPRPWHDTGLSRWARANSGPSEYAAAATASTVTCSRARHRRTPRRSCRTHGEKCFWEISAFYHCDGGYVPGRVCGMPRSCHRSVVRVRLHRRGQVQHNKTTTVMKPAVVACAHNSVSAEWEPACMPLRHRKTAHNVSPLRQDIGVNHPTIEPERTSPTGYTADVDNAIPRQVPSAPAAGRQAIVETVLGDFDHGSRLGRGTSQGAPR